MTYGFSSIIKSVKNEAFVYIEIPATGIPAPVCLILLTKKSGKTQPFKKCLRARL
jgi:hypothetical protein